MSATKTWNVRVSRFPFGIGDKLGEVGGVDRHDAQRKAEDLYGRNVVVEPAHAVPNTTEQKRVGPPLDLPEPERPMTADEAQMARELACKLTGKQSGKAFARTLHARSIRPDRSITGMEAKLLRAYVLEHRELLSPHIVELAGGAS